MDQWTSKGSTRGSVGIAKIGPGVSGKSGRMSWTSRCDDDADGLIDESGFGGLLERSCYAAAEDTLGVGQCRPGNQICSDGFFGACEGSVTPRPEQCNGVDNDCDGLVDEGLRNECGACDEDPVEVCDEVDNDCDGLTDGYHARRQHLFSSQ